MAKGQMDHLDQLEAESIFILREAYKKLDCLRNERSFTLSQQFLLPRN